MKQQVWSPETMGMVETEREYTAITLLVKEDRGRFEDRGMVNVVFYYDGETGILVSDPLRFEAWLEQRRL